MRKTFTAAAIATAVLYAFFLFYMLFCLVGRGMVVMSEQMLKDYNYWNSVNLIPFKTISEFISSIIDENGRGHAIRNLVGNLLLLIPLGFYLPFFIRRMNKFIIFGITSAVLIIVVELAQVLTMTGSFDIDDFLLNFTGAISGYLVFTRTPARSLFKLRAW